MKQEENSRRGVRTRLIRRRSPRVDLPPCPNTTAPFYRAPSPDLDATSMPKLCGNSTVLRQNRNAIRCGVGPIRLAGRMHSADTGPKQHIVSLLRSVPSIYESAVIPKPILTVIAPRPQPARSPACAEKFTEMVNAS